MTDLDPATLDAAAVSALRYRRSGSARPLRQPDSGGAAMTTAIRPVPPIDPPF